MSRPVLFITPSPRMLRAGAVWVTIGNWREAASQRWGHTVHLTPDGPLDSEHLRAAAGGGPVVPRWVNGRHPHAARTMAETAAKDFRAWWWMSRFDRRMRRDPPDVDPLFVWQHHDLFQRAGFTISRYHGAPLVLFVDAPIVWEASTWGVRRPGWGRFVESRGERPQFREADLVACVSEEVAAAVVAQGAHPDRVIVTPCTADAIRSASPGRDVRSEYGLDGELVIGWIGSFRPFHNADAVVRAVASLPKTAGLCLLMVGDGPTREACRKLAAELGLGQAVFPGSVPHERVPDLLSAMDVAVIPPVRGDFHYSPLKLKEYLAAGKPVVAPAVGEMQRFLESGRDAILYPAGDEAAMTAALAALVGSREDREAIGERARITYDRLFTMDRQLDAVSKRIGLS